MPIPQPGHQMCGMRSDRRSGSRGLTASVGCQVDCWVQNVQHRLASTTVPFSSGLCTHFRVLNAAGLGLTVGGALHLVHHLPEIEFGYYKGFNVRAIRNLLLGEWPCGYQSQLCRLSAFAEPSLRVALPRRNAVETDHVGVSRRNHLLRTSNMRSAVQNESLSEAPFNCFCWICGVMFG